MENSNCNNPAQALASAYILILRQAVESKVKFRVSTPRDFELLSEIIGESGAGMVSASTLKRIWGYVKDTPGRHTSTLDVLARFVGFSGGSAEFMCHCDKNSESESGFHISRVLMADTLSPGMRVRLTWAPDREMILRCIGRCTFEVEKAINTKLRPGSRVSCSQFVEGKPLNLDVAVGRGCRHLIYEAGRLHGITWHQLH